MNRRDPHAGFTLLPVMLAMTLIAAIAFLLNRDNGVNAEMIASRADLDKARYAAEAGLQAVNAAIQTIGCSGGGYPNIGNPVTNSNFGGASYSAYATSSGGNTTGLVSTGVYNGTSVRLTRNNVIVYQLAAKTYTLQPDAATGIDTYLVLNSATNYGNATILNLNSTSNFPLIKFDLSMFPAGSMPLSASLSLYAGSGLGIGFGYLYRLRNTWQPGTGASSPVDGANWMTTDGVTPWTSAGGDYHPTATAVAAAVTGSSMVFDNRDQAVAWLSGRYPNQGQMIRLTGLGSLNFTSSNNSDVVHRPKLTFNYLVPCGASGPGDPVAGSVTLNAIADTFDDSGAVQANNGGATNLLTYRTSTQDNRILIAFDTSSIPTAATIQSAILRLYVSGVNGATTNTKAIWANAVNEAWAEGTGNNTNKNCPTTPSAGASWNFSTNCANWSVIHPPSSTQAWTAMAPMPTARSSHMVTTVGGKIYAIGGYSSTGGYLNVVEEYTPATNTWTTRAQMPTACSDAAVAVVNGKIYVIGGNTGGGSGIDLNQVYDPSTDTWANKAVMPNGRRYLAAAVVNNVIYALGGRKTTTAVKNNEAYDPASDTWTTKAQMPTAREWFVAEPANGKLYAIGGYPGSGSSLAVNEEYDPVSNTWATRAPMPVGTDSLASAAIGNRIYLIAGIQTTSVTNQVWMYDALSNSYTAQLNYPQSLQLPGSVALNGYIYSAGGDNFASTYYKIVNRYDPGWPPPVATAVDENSGITPLASGFNGGWITFELKALVQEWVSGARPNTGIVIHTEVADKFSINSRESNTKTPQLVVNYLQ